MKRKTLIAVIVLLLITTGVVSAANWGKFEGYSIVRLLINGKEAKVQDVPAVSLNSRTMVPIYMLREAGLDVSWDGSNSTVSVDNQSNVDKDKILETAIALDHYKYLLEYYHMFNSLHMDSIDSYNNSDIVLAADVTVRYIESLNYMDEIREQLNFISEYLGVNHVDTITMKNIYTQFENSMSYLSKSIDYHNDLMNNNTKNNYDKFYNELSKLNASNDNAKLLIDKRYSELQKMLYNY